LAIRNVALDLGSPQGGNYPPYLIIHPLPF
jgi:hypothetical protein